MFVKLKNFRVLFKSAVKLAPIELFASLFFFLISVIDYSLDYKIGEWLWSFPMCFCLIYTINRLTCQSSVRWIYYVSVLSIPAFWWWNLQTDHSVFWVSLIISQLLVTLGVKQINNDSFVENALCYVRDMSAAILLTLLGWLLACAIYISVVYIFDLVTNESRFMSYSGETAFFLVLPFIFLMFNTRRNEGFVGNAFLGVLINFIISPALLIYNLILYIYFVKIAIVWSLPKGGIAYMVLSFAALLFISKSVQFVLRRRYYDWYYNYFSCWILPPLVMLWISILFRIGQYGWTESRVYLTLAAIIVSVTMVLFFYSRWRRYHWVVMILSGILILFTYIPGMDAESLGLRSQENRIKKAIKVLYSENNEKWTERTDSLTLKQYERLYNSFVYMQRVKDEAYMREHFGLTKEKLDYFIPDEVMESVRGYKKDKKTIYLNFEDDKTLVVADFDTLQILSYREGYYDVTTGWWSVYNQSDINFQINLNQMFREKLEEFGIDTTQTLTFEKIEKVKNSFRYYELDNRQVVMKNIKVDPTRLIIESFTPQFLLSRKK